MTYSVQAYTIKVGDVLAVSGKKVTSVASGARFIVVTTEGNVNYLIPNNQLVGIKE